MKKKELSDCILKLRKKPIRMAFCYDFDKTLSPADMQDYSIIPSLEMTSDKFWEESNALAKANRMDTNLAWMYKLLILSKAKGVSIKNEYYREVGKKVGFYNGVEEWFNLVNEYASKRGIEAEHYIISSGLREVIEGSKIADNFKKIYASSYLYSDGVAVWPAQAINYTNKTQYIFRIAKGFFEETDKGVNDSMHDSELYIPYENFVYIGDSETDIPCMRLVKSKGGYSIGVFDPKKNNKEKVCRLFSDGRLTFYTSADYSKGNELMNFIEMIIDEVAAREKIKLEKEILNKAIEQPKIISQLKALSLEELDDIYKLVKHSKKSK